MQLEAAWTLTLLAEEASARWAMRQRGCGRRLLRMLASSKDHLAEAAGQLVVRLSYDPECAQMLTVAGAKHVRQRFPTPFSNAFFAPRPGVVTVG